MTFVTSMRRHGLFEARVPRYTSYPTANHFSTDVGPRHFSEWLQSVPEGTDVSLYVHVPFCRRLCWFCACRTQGTATGDPVRAYVGHLLKEIELVAETMAPGVRLSRMHWGGGTPTMMTPDEILRLSAVVRGHFPFAEDAEFSVEIDPNEIDEARLDALAEAGMNRASIGVQDFDPRIQATIGREQSFEVTRDVAEGLRRRGISSLNADILFGLPHQTRSGIVATVEKLLSLNPDRVALYGYAHVPWMARRQALIPTDALPRPEDRLVLFETAAKLFLWDGYEAIGIDHFARSTDGLALAARQGRLRRNFQGYTDDQAKVLIGLGASSISQFPEGFAQNAPATSAWVGAVEAGKFSTARGHVLTPGDRLRSAAIERLMCDFAIDCEDVAQRSGAEVAEVEALVAPLPERFPDVVRTRKGGVEIVEGGRAMTRLVARALDAWEVKSEGHSLAI